MSPATSPTVFVTAATGSQGDAVARQLRQIGWSVHATVRDISSPGAQALKAIGVNLTEGGWDNEAAIETSLSGCTKVFLNLMPDISNMDSELHSAERIIALSKAAGVAHCIYSSAFGVHTPEKVTGLDLSSIVGKAVLSKNAIEKAVRAADFKTYTILRPGNFMANFLLPKVMMYTPLAQEGIWNTALRPDTGVPLVDHEDIARFAVAAFQDPERFAGVEQEIAGPTMTPDEIMDQLSAAAGKKLVVKFLTDEEIDEQSVANPFIKAQLIMRDLAKYYNLDQVLSYGIPLHTFQQFLEREADAVKKTYQ